MVTNNIEYKNMYRFEVHVTISPESNIERFYDLCNDLGVDGYALSYKGRYMLLSR